METLNLWKTIPNSVQEKVMYNSTTSLGFESQPLLLSSFQLPTIIVYYPKIFLDWKIIRQSPRSDFLYIIITCTIIYMGKLYCTKIELLGKGEASLNCWKVQTLAVKKGFIIFKDMKYFKLPAIKLCQGGRRPAVFYWINEMAFEITH